MKINTNNPLKNYSDLRLRTKESAVVSAGTAKNRNFDAITIQSDPRQIEEHTFGSMLAREVMREASVPASEERVADLKQQISSGSYHMDPKEIARKMLLI
jgi:flagellar biosynthesis anti-sigma factor FlgM